MKKRSCTFLAPLLLCALLLTLSPTGFALGYGQEYEGYQIQSNQQYRDVPTSHWAYSSIETCSQRKWFGGYPDGTFGPERLIQRDEAAKVFAVALSLTIEENPTVTFTDTSSNWAKAYIEATKNLFPNVSNLQGTSSFRPGQTITREETIYALVVAWRYASKVTNADLSVLNMFSDANSISAGVKPYVAVAINEGLVSGFPDGTIGAQKGLTRAEFATLLARALSHGYGPDCTDAPKITLDRYSSTTTDETVQLSGQISPMASGTRLMLDGEDVTLSSNGSFHITLELEEGTNTFELVAKNTYGVNAAKTITVERGLPEVSIRLLNSLPSETAQGSVSVNGVIENFSSGCTLLLNDRRISVDSDGFFETTLTLEAGQNSFDLVVLRQGEEVANMSIHIARLSAEGAGQWLEELPDEVTTENYNIEMKGQYRSRKMETTESEQAELDGWTMYDKTTRYSDWSAWSEWQSGFVVEDPDFADLRQVETRTSSGGFFDNDEYRERTRERISVYYYSRWSDWSDWSDSEIVPEKNMEIEKRTVYRFTLK